jgi:hypothetical protein
MCFEDSQERVAAGLIESESSIGPMAANQVSAKRCLLSVFMFNIVNWSRLGCLSIKREKNMMQRLS